MPEMRFRQPGFTYSACAPFTKKKQKQTNKQRQNTKS